MMADSPPGLFPDFAELCRQARGIEKNPLKLQPSQISDALEPGEGEAIFPKDFESYTYAYLLGEAQKIERRVFAARYQSAAAPPSAKPKQQGAASQEEQELRQFASAQKPEELPPVAPFAIETQPKAQLPPIPSIPLIKRDSAPAQPTQKQEEEEKPPAPDSVPYEAEEFEEEQGDNLPLPSEPGEEEEAVPKKEEAPVSSRRESSFSSTSKLSPRLRAIIEEKLRRDDEKSRAQQEAGPEAPAPEPEPAQKEGEIVMSSRERLLRKLQKAEAPIEEQPEAAEGLSQEEGAGGQPREEEEERAAPIPPARRKAESAKEELHELEKEEGTGMEEEPPDAEKEEGAGEERMEGEPPELEKETPEEKAGGAPLEERGKPARSQIAAGRPIPPGSLLIKQIFTGDEEAAPSKKEKEEPLQEERLRRIQRIMGELAPDKYRAAAAPKASVAQEEIPASKLRKKPVELPQMEEEEAPLEEPEEEAEGQPGRARTRLAKKIGSIFSKQRKGPAQETEEEETAQPRKKSAKKSEEQEQPEEEKEIPAAKRRNKPLRRQQKEEETEAVPQEAPEEEAEEQPVPQQKQAPSSKSISQSRAPKKSAKGKAAQVPILGKAGSKKKPQAAAAKKAQPVEPEPEEEEREFPKTLVRAAKPAQQEEAPKKGVRILPGGIAVPRAQQKTYVPPARQQLTREMQSQQEEDAARKAELFETVPKKAADDRPSDEGKTPGELEEEKRRQRQASALASKLAQAKEAAKRQKPPAAQEAKELRTPPDPKKTRDIAGEAKLPEEEEEADIEVPKPPEDQDEEDAPKPQQYEQAKEEFKKKMTEEDIKEKAKVESDEMLEEHAKENYIWLYEVYKMGGISREDFLQKVREKIAEEKGSAQKPAQPEAPANPALAALGKEIDSKPKK